MATLRQHNRSELVATNTVSQHSEQGEYVYRTKCAPIASGSPKEFAFSVFDLGNEKNDGMRVSLNLGPALTVNVRLVWFAAIVTSAGRYAVVISSVLTSLSSLSASNVSLPPLAIWKWNPGNVLYSCQCGSPHMRHR